MDKNTICLPLISKTKCNHWKVVAEEYKRNILLQMELWFAPGHMTPPLHFRFPVTAHLPFVHVY